MRMKTGRRDFLKACTAAGTASWLAPSLVYGTGLDQPIHIGSRRELFVDDYLVEQISGQAKLCLHRPVPREVVFTTDSPWEGNTCAYYTLFQDDDMYRMYYRASGAVPNSELICYAYSHDGIHWIRPVLGLIEFNGSAENNIVHDGVARHNFAPFKDTNPDCAKDAAYKAIGGHARTGGLYAFKSADGIRWELLSDQPVFPSVWEKKSGWGQPWFDSHNLAFWDPVKNQYVLFFRHFSRDGAYRDIMTCTSPDLLTWSAPEYLEYPGAPQEHLYTNGIMPYERAPHIYIGFPTRFLSLTAQTEPLFMSSRDGRVFKRWPDAVIPLDAPEERSGNRSNYMWRGLLSLPGNDREYSVYAHEGYYAGTDSRLRRFTYRADGFVSVQAPAEGGELETKLLTFTGSQLVVNIATRNDSAGPDGGSLRVEIIEAGGYPVEGFSLSDCIPLQGDSIDHPVAWKSGRDVGVLAGTPIRLRFHLQNADLYSFRFVPLHPALS